MPARTARAETGALRLLYLGRLERRKGVQNLVRAITGLEGPNVHLTLLGGDTGTAPLGGSVRTQLELMAAGDPRIEFVDTVPRSAVGDFIRNAHAVVIPSLWECWPNTAREALMHNRPVLATPVGGLTEIVKPGRSGWLTRDRSAEGDPRRGGRARRAPGRGAGPDPVRRAARGVRRAGRTRRRWSEGYRRLVAEAPARPARPARPPLVSIVIPYFRLERYVRETVASGAAQTHPEIEIVIVNDGSLRAEDRVVYELADEFGARIVTQANSGLGAARNMGISQSRGRYVVPLDADDTIAPDFVARCVRDARA